MAMLEKHRSSIYRSLVPILGEEETQAMLSEFPASDGDEPVTRDHLRAELALTREQLRGEVGELRTEMAELRVEMHALANRSTVWLSGTIFAAAGLVIAFG